MSLRSRDYDENDRALDHVRDKLKPRSFTGRVTFHIHKGLIRKLEWHSFQSADNLDASSEAALPSD